MLAFASSDPLEAGPTETMATISRQGWDYMSRVRISSVDDFKDDGDQDFTVSADLVYTADSTYSALLEDIDDRTFSFTSLDDSNDPQSRYDAALRMGFASTSNHYTTEYGATVEISVSLTTMPTSRVTYTVTVDDATEGNVQYPSVIVFTKSNYAQNQSIFVAGVGDTELDGDVSYKVIMNLLDTSDPYYSRIKRQSLTVVNQEIVVNRIALGIEPDACNTTEGGDSCSITASLCLARLGSCVTKLTASDIYDPFDSSGYSVLSITIVATVLDPRVAYLSQGYSADTTLNNTGNDTSIATLTLREDSVFDNFANVSVSAFDDLNLDGNQLTTVSFSAYMTYGSGNTKYQYDLVQAYTPNVTVKAIDDESYSVRFATLSLYINSRFQNNKRVLFR